MIPSGFLLISTLLYGSRLARANCEHAHFHGPSATQALPAVDALKDHVQVLTPEIRSLKVNLDSQFPSPDGPPGLPTWFLLDGLLPGQRYETRACYAATQPTDVKLEAFELQAVHDSPELLASLTQSVERYQPSLDASALYEELRGILSLNGTSDASLGRQTSTLLLRIIATTDYFTDDQELMKKVPPTYTEIILDPWVYGLIPATAVPIVAYILAVVAVAYPIGRVVARKIESILEPESMRDKKVR